MLADIFTHFSQDPDVGKELEALFRGNPPDREELRYLFEQAGFDPNTLSGLDFEEGMTAFEAGFLAAATEEPALQGTIQTHQLLTQTHLQRELVASMRELVDLLHAVDKRDTELLAEAGVDVVLRRGWYEGTHFWSPELFRRFFAPGAKELIELTHQADTVFGWTMSSGIMAPNRVNRSRPQASGQPWAVYCPVARLSPARKPAR